jgi:hypothetical protein
MRRGIVWLSVRPTLDTGLLDPKWEKCTTFGAVCNLHELNALTASFPDPSFFNRIPISYLDNGRASPVPG